MIRVSFFYKKWSHLNGLSIVIVKFENCWTSIFGDHRYWRKLSLDHGCFPEMIPRWKMFLGLSILDIQWENQCYSISQILQNNDLPTVTWKIIVSMLRVIYNHAVNLEVFIDVIELNKTGIILRYNFI